MQYLKNQKGSDNCSQNRNKKNFIWKILINAKKNIWHKNKTRKSQKKLSHRPESVQSVRLNRFSKENLVSESQPTINFLQPYPKYVLPFKLWMIELCGVVDDTTKVYESRIKYI
jgi:hypothetical protein